MLMLGSRFKAFSIHFFLSTLTALAALIWVFWIWYPPPLDEALGVTRVFITVVLVDVVLGPLLTFLVYDKQKKSLFFDLTVIVTIQISALVYGIWVLAEARPAWVVFNVDRFDLVQVADIDRRDIGRADFEYQSPPWLGPKWVGAISANDKDLRNTILFEAALGGPDIPHRPFLYRPLSEFESALQARALPLEQLAKFNSQESVEDVVARWPDTTGWVPLMARAEPMVVLLGNKNTKVVAVVALRPWE